jgi:hypothetical protein
MIFLITYLSDTVLSRLLTNQIIHLSVTIKGDITSESSEEDKSNMLQLILFERKCLIDLTCSQWFLEKVLESSTLNIISASYVSSNLTELKIKVKAQSLCVSKFKN